MGKTGAPTGHFTIMVSAIPAALRCHRVYVLVCSKHHECPRSRHPYVAVCVKEWFVLVGSRSPRKDSYHPSLCRLAAVLSSVCSWVEVLLGHDFMFGHYPVKLDARELTVHPGVSEVSLAKLEPRSVQIPEPFGPGIRLASVRFGSSLQVIGDT